MRPFPLRELISPNLFSAVDCLLPGGMTPDGRLRLLVQSASALHGWQKQWTVLLHTGVTTRRDLLTRFYNSRLIIFARNHRGLALRHALVNTGE